MIRKERLQGWLEDNWVMIDKWGERIVGPVPINAGPAALVIGSVTDALKRVDGSGLISESLDRDQMWKVSGIVLNRVVVDKLPERDLTVEELIDEVKAMGLAWHLSSTSVL